VASPATVVRNESRRSEQCTLITVVRGSADETVGRAESTREIPAGESVAFEQTLAIASPRPWSVEEPNLYIAQTTAKLGERVVDEYDTPFGVREIRFDPQKGFFLSRPRLRFGLRGGRE
jgi:beta-galactosidase